jgi:hypothetical protein
LPAFLLSVADDRGGLADMSRDAIYKHERWGDADLARLIARRWQGDAEIENALRRVTPIN